MTGTSAVRWIKLASWVYGSVMSIVKIHFICRTISTLPYISTEGHITFHLAILQSVALCFTIGEPKKHQILHWFVMFPDWESRHMLVNPVCSGSGVSEQPSRDSDDAQNATAHFIRASAWVLPFCFAARYVSFFIQSFKWEYSHEKNTRVIYSKYYRGFEPYYSKAH